MDNDGQRVESEALPRAGGAGGVIGLVRSMKG